MENKHVTGIIDNLNTPSIPEKQPMFQLTNFFKPTAKNVTMLGLAMRASAITILASAFSTQSIKIFIIGVVIGFVGELIVLFSKEEPISTIVRAAEDIQQTAIAELNTPCSTTQPIEDVQS